MERLKESTYAYQQPVGHLLKAGQRYAQRTLKTIGSSIQSTVDSISTDISSAYAAGKKWIDNLFKKPAQKKKRRR